MMGLLDGSHHTRSPRVRAFASAVREYSSDPDRIGASHPDPSARVACSDPALGDIVEVLIREAAAEAPSLEGRRADAWVDREATVRRSLEYYLARRNQEDVAQISDATKQIPSFWLALIDLSPDRAASAIAAVGRDVIASGLASMDNERRLKATSSLSADAATELMRWESDSSPVVGASVAAMLARCSRTTPALIAEEVGMMILATLRERLSAPVSRALDMLSRTNLSRVLQVQPVSDLGDEASAELAGTVLRRATEAAGRTVPREGGVDR